MLHVRSDDPASEMLVGEYFSERRLRPARFSFAMVDVKSRFQKLINSRNRYICENVENIAAYLFSDSLQGLDTHMKSIITSAFCIDSRCQPMHGFPMEWYIRNHLVAGFANSNLRKLCNSKFVTFGNEVFVVATKPIKVNEEVFVFYKVTKKDRK